LVEVSLDQIIKLYRLAAVGKLSNGLIHNLNGPLQNLCMDMEMINLHLSENKKSDEELKKDIQKRIRRMEYESEQIIQILKATSNRGYLGGGDFENADLSTWINQELFFLKSDLYFKHNIQTFIDISDVPLPLSQVPEGFTLSVSWLIQALIENAEEYGVTRFTIRAEPVSNMLEMTFSLEGDSVSDGLLQRFRLEDNANHPRHSGINDLDMDLVLMALQSNGISMDGRSEPCIVHLTLQCPLSN
jgi:hypothetical protein